MLLVGWKNNRRHCRDRILFSGLSKRGISLKTPNVSLSYPVSIRNLFKFDVIFSFRSWAIELRKQSFILFYLFTTCKFLLKFTSSNFLLRTHRCSREAAAQLYQFCIAFQEADFLRTKQNKNKPADVKHGREENCFYKVICRGLQQVPTCHHVTAPPLPNLDWRKHRATSWR